MPDSFYWSNEFVVIKKSSFTSFHIINYTDKKTCNTLTTYINFLLKLELDVISSNEKKVGITKKMSTSRTEAENSIEKVKQRFFLLQLSDLQ